MGTKANYRQQCLVLLILVAANISTYAGEWEAHKQSLQNHVTQAADLEKEIKTLIEHKRHETDRAELQKIMKEIEAKHKKLEETYKKYNEELGHTKHRHPEQGDSAQRSYTIFKPKTVEQFENDIGLDGKLDRAKKSLERHYNTPPEDPKFQRRKVEVKPEEKDNKPERIILRK